MVQEAKVARRGIYNNEYFSGAQVSLYIGDVWVDEITTLSYGYQQSRTPIYGYASTLFDDVSEGHVLVTGQFTINFKEAGYLWLILNHYREQFKRAPSLTHPFKNSGLAERSGIDRIINGEITVAKRNKFFQELADSVIQQQKAQRAGNTSAVFEGDIAGNIASSRTAARTSLGGFASDARSVGTSRGGSLGEAERRFEKFEDEVWGLPPEILDEQDRRADDPRLNPFEIYVAFGDFAGDNTANHTIERLRDVYILGKSKQIVIDGMPIQEQYSFISRNIV